MNEAENCSGKVVRIAGPVVRATGLDNVRLYDVVRVGDLGLIGEVIRLSEGIITIQVYEDTSGIRVGEPVQSTGLPLVAQLGPGLLGQVYDGLQRPLEILAQVGGEFIQRGVYASPLPAEKRWRFIPRVSVGEVVNAGDIVGVVPESRTIEHRIMVPPRQRGRVIQIREGEFTIDEAVVVIGSENGAGVESTEISLIQRWPVRQPRPSRSRLAPREPLITGTRIIDVFFPVAKGGSAIIPGGFGTGKTVTEHSLARWADADVVVYVGCGERG
ncbi:MAG: V-type ATP synthase subunit A, partial [Chloroflexi bacterium]|nr:V-type ATP synthase subunit A [Chloroflexota bacterium]